MFHDDLTVPLPFFECPHHQKLVIISHHLGDAAQHLQKLQVPNPRKCKSKCKCKCKCNLPRHAPQSISIANVYTGLLRLAVDPVNQMVAVSTQFIFPCVTPLPPRQSFQIQILSPPAASYFSCIALFNHEWPATERFICCQVSKFR